ncbi:MAG: hypothetical protein B1H04_05735 [Planctomycetales bacterium 4484_123]|nr:MAG: hypothetical protein B1H04_05735 [Planctomycetales bacterium 4484_123]
MAPYLVLARKYRSATFEEVVGQEHVAATLVNAIKTGRVAHGFLFTGTRGVGKTTMARILAKALNCLSVDAPTPEPCNTCDACVAIARGDDIDVVEIDGASNRGIDEIRELRSNAIYRPARCRFKIYYIDEVHMLTKEAFNALLKTLEEPPAHVKFIFSTTEVHRVPATIVSRCQRFDFRNIPTRLIAEHLGKICQAEEVEVCDEALFRIARAAAGSMRDGLSLLDQLLAAGGGKVTEADVIRILGTPSDEATAGIVSAIAAGDPGAALSGLDELLGSGVTLESALAAVGEMFRHMMLIQACGPDSHLVELPDSQRQRAVELAGKFSLPALVQAVSLCQVTARNLRGLTSGRGLAEAALVRLAAAEKFVDARSLLARLEALEGSAPAPRAASAGRPGIPAGTAANYRRPTTRGQKKKIAPPHPPAAPSAGAGPVPPSGAANSLPARADSTSPPPRPPEPEPLRDPKWDGEYLKANWPAVVAELARRRQGYVAGLLGPAVVLGLEGQTLRLGYDEAHETIRRRCEERMDGEITTVLGQLFGQEVRCQYVPTGRAGKAPAPRQPTQSARLSSAQRDEVANDPAVRAVMDYFQGSLFDVRLAGPPKAEENDAEEHDS